MIFTIWTFHLINSFPLSLWLKLLKFTEKAWNGRKKTRKGMFGDCFCVCVCVSVCRAVAFSPLTLPLTPLFSITHICVRPTAAKKKWEFPFAWSTFWKMEKWWKFKKNIFRSRSHIRFHQMVSAGERRKQKSMREPRDVKAFFSFKVWLSVAAAGMVLKAIRRDFHCKLFFLSRRCKNNH